jgi:hypothetical protein
MPATWRNCERTPNCGAASADYGLCVVNIDGVDARKCAATQHRELPVKSLAEVTENNVLKISPVVGVERFELPTLWSQSSGTAHEISVVDIWKRPLMPVRSR